MGMEGETTAREIVREWQSLPDAEHERLDWHLRRLIAQAIAQTTTQAREAMREEAAKAMRWARWFVYVGDEVVAGFTYADQAQRWAEASYRGRYRLVQRNSDDALPVEPTDALAPRGEEGER